VSKLRIEQRHVDDVTVLVLTGQMLLDDGDLPFRRQASALVESGRVKIVVDLGDVTCIDSSGIGMMVAQLKIVQQRGRHPPGAFEHPWSAAVRPDEAAIHVRDVRQRRPGRAQLRKAAGQDLNHDF
jgi:anti-anti-sigma factor